MHVAHHGNAKLLGNSAHDNQDGDLTTRSTVRVQKNDGVVRKALPLLRRSSAANGTMEDVSAAMEDVSAAGTFSET